MKYLSQYNAYYREITTYSVHDLQNYKTYQLIAQQSNETLEREILEKFNAFRLSNDIIVDTVYEFH